MPGHQYRTLLSHHTCHAVSALRALVQLTDCPLQMTLTNSPVSKLTSAFIQVLVTGCSDERRVPSEARSGASPPPPAHQPGTRRSAPPLADTAATTEVVKTSKGWATGRLCPVTAHAGVGDVDCDHWHTNDGILFTVSVCKKTADFGPREANCARTDTVAHCAYGSVSDVGPYVGMHL